MALRAEDVYGALLEYVNKHINSIGGLSQTDLETAILSHDSNVASHSKQRYKQTISIPSNVWVVQHNLNCKCTELTIIPVNKENNTMLGELDVDSSTNNMLVLRFEKAVAGEVTVKL